MTPAERFPGRLGVQQRVLPAYRIPFIERLAQACHGGLEVFAGEPEPEEAILAGREPRRAVWVKAKNQDLFGGPFYLLRQPGLSRWIETWDPQGLVLEANPRYLSNWAAARRARAQGRTVLGWGLGAPGASRPIAGMVWRAFLARFDGLVAYSSQGADQYRKAGVPAERVFIAVNATVDGPEALPEREPPRDRPARLLFVGRLQPRKRVDLLLRACAELSADPDLRIVGDGPARRRLEGMAARAYPKAEFIGALEGDALEEAFRWADLFVLPGTGGLAVQQAMAFGLPAVVAEGDGTQRDLIDRSNGWLVPPNDVSALIRALREAVENPEGLPRKGQVSHQRVNDSVNLNAMVGSFVEALLSVERG